MKWQYSEKLILICKIKYYHKKKKCLKNSFYARFTGVDILQKRPKNVQGGINSAQAKLSESRKRKWFYSLELKKIVMFLL